jgi:hypothetical protein
MTTSAAQRSTVEHLEQTLEQAADSHRWRRVAAVVIPGSRRLAARVAGWASLAVFCYPLAPIWIPAIAVTTIGLSRERRRARRRLAADIERARAVLAQLGGAPNAEVFRGTSALLPGAAAAPGGMAAAFAACDRALLVRASVSAASDSDPSRVFNGVALVAWLADQDLLAFGVWSDERDPSIDEFLVEVREAIRTRLPCLAATEYWSWTQGIPESLQITRPAL